MTAFACRCHAEARESEGGQTLPGSLYTEMIQFQYVYILQTVSKPHRFYIGYSQDLTKRLQDHNQGRSTFTSRYRPWKIRTAIAFSDKTKALAFEKYLEVGEPLPKSNCEFHVKAYSQTMSLGATMGATGVLVLWSCPQIMVSLT